MVNTYPLKAVDVWSTSTQYSPGLRAVKSFVGRASDAKDRLLATLRRSLSVDGTVRKYIKAKVIDKITAFLCK